MWSQWIVALKAPPKRPETRPKSRSTSRCLAGTPPIHDGRGFTKQDIGIREVTMIMRVKLWKQCWASFQTKPTPPPKKNTHTHAHTHTRKEQTDLPKRTSGGYRGNGDAAIKRSKCLVRENGLTDFISRVVLGGKCSTPLGQVSRKKRPGISHVMHPFVFLFCCLGCLQLGIAWSTCLDGDFNGTCRMLILCFERSEKGLTVAVFGASAKKFGKP